MLSEVSVSLCNEGRHQLGGDRAEWDNDVGGTSRLTRLTNPRRRPNLPVQRNVAGDLGTGIAQWNP